MATKIKNTQTGRVVERGDKVAAKILEMADTPWVLADEETPPPPPSSSESDVDPDLDLSAADGTIADVLARVDGDPDAAALALMAESAKDSPRGSLIKALEELTDD